MLFFEVFWKQIFENTENSCQTESWLSDYVFPLRLVSTFYRFWPFITKSDGWSAIVHIVWNGYSNNVIHVTHDLSMKHTPN